MKATILIFGFLLAALAASSPLVAKDAGSDEKFWPEHRLGFCGSMMTGYGLFYQNHSLEDYTFKGTIFGYGKSGADNYDDQLEADIGFEIQRNLKRTRQTRFYLLLGSYFRYNESKEYYYVYNSNPQFTKIERYTNIGTGFGFEVIVWNHLSFNFDCGYYGQFGRNNELDQSWDNILQKSIIKKVTRTPREFGFGVGGGISYAL